MYVRFVDSKVGLADTFVFPTTEHSFEPRAIRCVERGAVIRPKGKMSDKILKFMAAHERLVAAQEAVDAGDVAEKPISDDEPDKRFDERNGALWSLIRLQAPTQTELLLKLKWLRRVSDDEREIGSEYADGRTQHMIGSILRDYDAIHIS